MAEKIIPDGYKLVAVKGLDELVYWLERCKDKGHLENCADLIEPFEAFEYRNISEEAVIAAHEAKAVPSRADQLVRKYIECLVTNDPDGASDATKSMVDYVFNCPPATTHEAKAAPTVPDTDELESALERLVERCNTDQFLCNDDAVIHAEATLERVYKSRKSTATPTAPSQPVTLTDEEICECFGIDGADDWVFKGAHAIISALRKKEGK